MSKQWGHGFHQGKNAQVIDVLAREQAYGIDLWLTALRAGDVISRIDWDADSKRVFLKNGVLFVCEDGSTTQYEICDADMELEWFGFVDFDDIEIEQTHSIG